MGDPASAKSKNNLTPRKEITYDGKIYDVTREGLAEILTLQQAPRANGNAGEAKAKAGHKNERAHQTVFYNPIQQYNRDLSVLAIRAFAEDSAVVRLARQERRKDNPEGAKNRGKKRKRGQDHDGTKKRKAEEEERSSLATERTNLGSHSSEGITTAGFRGDDGYVLDTAGREGTGTMVGEREVAAEAWSNQHDEENGAQGDLESRPEGAHGEQEPPGANLDISDPPKGPKQGVSASSVPAFRILDALSATGLRALRYAKEIPLASSVVANDLSPSATASIKVNVVHNALTSKVTTTTSDALEHMYTTMSRSNGRMPHPYHVIDLDPYGTAAPFLDAAVQAVTDGGLLCVTCTDAGVFASTGYPEKTFSQYGGLSLKGAHAHEAGLRLILNAIASAAARYGIAIEPLLSLSIDFYARIFVRLHRSPAQVKFLASKTMVVYQCDGGCGSWKTQHLAQAKGKEARNGETIYKFTSALGPNTGIKCEHCGFKTHLAGPMWGGALHNPFFVQRILDMLPELDKEIYQTVPRLEGMLTMALDESLDDPWASIADPKKRSPSANAPEATSLATTTEATTTTNDKPDPPSTSPNSSSNRSRPVPPLPAHYRVAHPFFIHPPTLARTLNTPTPSDAALRGALRHLGYLTSRSHTKPGSITTNAPWDVIWEIMREWTRQQQQQQQGSKDSDDGDGDVNNNSNKNSGHQGRQLAPNTAGAGIMRNDRSKRRVQAAKKEVEARLAGVDSVEGLKLELEAALYRLGGGGGGDGGGAGNGSHGQHHVVAAATTTASTTATATTESTDGAAAAGRSSESITPAVTASARLDLLHALDIRFDERLGKDPASGGGGGGGGGPGKRRLVRYQTNPRENWGPLGRAKG